MNVDPIKWLLDETKEWLTDKYGPQGKRCAKILTCAVAALLLAGACGYGVYAHLDKKKPAPVYPQYSVDELIENSYYEYTNENYEEARKMLEDATRRKRKDHYAWYRMSMIYCYLGDKTAKDPYSYYMQGLQCAEKALGLHGKHEKAEGDTRPEYAPYYTKALCYYGLRNRGHAQDAIEAINEAIKQAEKRKAENGVYYSLRAKLYAYLEDYANAAKDREKAAVCYRQSYEAYIADGNKVKAREQLEDAINNLRGLKSDYEHLDDDAAAKGAKDEISELEALLKTS